MSSHWISHFKQFRQYLLLEKSLAEPSIEAYLHDVEALRKWSELRGMNRNPEAFNLQDLMAFSAWLAEIGFSASSQARILSGIRGFYRFLVLQNEIPIAFIKPLFSKSSKIASYLSKCFSLIVIFAI
ncbi:MAG: hypothetical protein EBV15_05910 [Bacteroidetes bacterium]|nr:hypothetical protein [Bacteroidota bacterium]